MNSDIITKQKEGEVPNYVIRLRKSKVAPIHIFYCQESLTKTTIIPGQATRFFKGDAHIMISRQMSLSIEAYDLFTGAKVLPVERMLDADEPEKMIIKFHVANGKSFEEGK